MKKDFTSQKTFLLSNVVEDHLIEDGQRACGGCHCFGGPVPSLTLRKTPRGSTSTWARSPNLHSK